MEVLHLYVDSRGVCPAIHPLIPPLIHSIIDYLIRFVHIFFNVVVQLILGIPLEMVHKWWRVGIVYLSGVGPYSYLKIFSNELICLVQLRAV